MGETSSDAPGAFRRIAPVFAKFAVTGALVWWALSKASFADMVARLEQASSSWLLVVMLLAILQIACLSLRWWVVLRGQGYTLPSFEVWRNLMIGLFFNQFLPSGIGGDAARVWLLTRAKVPFGGALIAVFTDRGIGLIALVLLVGVALAFVSLLNPTGSAVANLLLPALAVLGTAIIIFYMLLACMPKLPKLAATKLQTYYEALRAVLLTPSTAVQLILLSTFVHLALLAAVAAFAGAFSITVPISAIFILIPPAMIVAMLPISIAGWGVRESSFVAALQLVNVSASDAVLLGLGIGVMQLGQGLIGGVVWLAARRFSSHRLPVR